MSATLAPAAAHPSETYLTEKFKLVKGMSSQTAATVCCRLMRDQSEQGVRGHVLEIGVYEGRFFIGLALCALPNERCIAIDTFDWPDPQVRDRFLVNCKDAAVNVDHVFAEAVSSAEVTPARLRELVGGPARFVHIDGAHGYEAVSHDLRLVKPLLHLGGVICMDDVLHPTIPGIDDRRLRFPEKQSQF